MLEKWQCHKCEKGWLLIEADAKEKEICCPFCHTAGDHVESVAGQNPDEDLEEEMGCLWPGYNQFDRVCYLMSRKVITQAQAGEITNKLLRGKKLDECLEEYGINIQPLE